MNLPDYTNCTLCPRMCHVNRSVTTGYCGCSSHISAARAAFAFWRDMARPAPCSADRKKNQAAAAPYFSPAVPYAAVSARTHY